jgi:hypothetical protein
MASLLIIMMSIIDLHDGTIWWLTEDDSDVDPESPLARIVGIGSLMLGIGMLVLWLGLVVF